MAGLRAVVRWEDEKGWSIPRVWLDGHEIHGILDVRVAHRATEKPRLILELLPELLTSDGPRLHTDEAR